MNTLAITQHPLPWRGVYWHNNWIEDANGAKVCNCTSPAARDYILKVVNAQVEKDDMKLNPKFESIPNLRLGQELGRLEKLYDRESMRQAAEIKEELKRRDLVADIKCLENALESESNTSPWNRE